MLGAKLKNLITPNLSLQTPPSPPKKPPALPQKNQTPRRTQTPQIVSLKAKIPNQKSPQTPHLQGPTRPKPPWPSRFCSPFPQNCPACDPGRPFLDGGAEISEGPNSSVNFRLLFPPPSQAAAPTLLPQLLVRLGTAPASLPHKPWD